MTATDHHVLDQLGTLAAEENWKRTADFLQDLPGGATGVVLFAAGEATPLLPWLGEHDAGPVDQRPLAPAAVQPDQLLVADRVVVALRAGRLLELEETEAVTAILGRPEPTRRLVLIGAPDDDPAAWLAAERTVWRVLLGGLEDWREQDLADHGCLRWAPPAASGDARVTRDRAALLAWLGTAGDDPELARLRALHALELAEAEQPGPVGGGAPDRSQQLSRISRTRRRATGRLDALAAAARREVTATLDMLGTDLVESTAREVRVALGGRSDARLAAAAAGTHLDRRMREWLAGTFDAIGDRVHEASQVVADDLDELDWDLDERAGAGPRLRSRRDAVTAMLRRPPRLSVPVPRGGDLSGRPITKDGPAAMYTALGALAGGAMGLLMPFPNTVLAGAALGAVGARAVQVQRETAAVDAWIGRHVTSAVPAVLTPLGEAARERITAVLGERRAEVDRLLDDLERHLTQPDQPAGPAADHRSALAELRRSLT
jgi:hypothetical protein